MIPVGESFKNERQPQGTSAEQMAALEMLEDSKISILNKYLAALSRYRNGPITDTDRRQALEHLSIGVLSPAAVTGSTQAVDPAKAIVDSFWNQTPGTS
jgi:hypothetical protein